MCRVIIIKLHFILSALFTLRLSILLEWEAFLSCMSYTRITIDPVKLFGWSGCYSLIFAADMLDTLNEQTMNCWELFLSIRKQFYSLCCTVLYNTVLRCACSRLLYLRLMLTLFRPLRLILNPFIVAVL